MSRNGNWTVSDWGNVMFTYESRFALEPDDKRIRICYKQGTHNQPQNIPEQHAFRVLEPIVRLYAAAVGPTFVLMDDTARPHRADIVDDYLESEGMAWPAYSPDLNLIEYFWDALGRVVSSRFPPPATFIELETALQEEWRLLNPTVVDPLIESMIRRHDSLTLLESALVLKFNLNYLIANPRRTATSPFIINVIIDSTCSGKWTIFWLRTHLELSFLELR
ncbi:transposable element Tcb1 transposase [Trichonephila clavipes]|nr:transposable element Tcb1 transposase [Trichonephila clavipes]